MCGYKLNICYFIAQNTKMAISQFVFIAKLTINFFSLASQKFFVDLKQSFYSFPKKTYVICEFKKLENYLLSV